MPFKSTYLGRRSIRQYKNKAVPLSVVGEIIDLAGYAPSSGNLQNWRFVIVMNKEKKQKITDACLDQSWMIEAPVFIIVCNDYDQVKEHYGKLGKLYSIQNCATVAFGITLAAHDLGLGTCWVGAFDNEAIQRILEIPDNIDPEVIITLGYSDEVKQPALREDPRLFSYFDKWGQKFTTFPSHLERLKERLTFRKAIDQLQRKK